MQDADKIKQIISSFMEWTFDRGYFLAKYHVHGDDCLDADGNMQCGQTVTELVATDKPIEDLVDQYLNK